MVRMEEDTRGRGLDDTQEDDPGVDGKKDQGEKDLKRYDLKRRERMQEDTLLYTERRGEDRYERQGDKYKCHQSP